MYQGQRSTPRVWLSSMRWRNRWVSSSSKQLISFLAINIYSNASWFLHYTPEVGCSFEQAQLRGLRAFHNGDEQNSTKIIADRKLFSHRLIMVIQQQIIADHELFSHTYWWLNKTIIASHTLFSQAYSQNKVERSPWLPDDRTPLPAKVFFYFFLKCFWNIIFSSQFLECSG